MSEKLRKELLKGVGVAYVESALGLFKLAEEQFYYNIFQNIIVSNV